MVTKRNSSKNNPLDLVLHQGLTSYVNNATGIFHVSVSIPEKWVWHLRAWLPCNYPFNVYSLSNSSLWKGNYNLTMSVLVQRLGSFLWVWRCLIKDSKFSRPIQVAGDARCVVRSLYSKRRITVLLQEGPHPRAQGHPVAAGHPHTGHTMSLGWGALHPKPQTIQHPGLPRQHHLTPPLRQSTFSVKFHLSTHISISKSRNILTEN